MKEKMGKLEWKRAIEKKYQNKYKASSHASKVNFNLSMNGPQLIKFMKLNADHDGNIIKIIHAHMKTRFRSTHCYITSLSHENASSMINVKSLKETNIHMSFSCNRIHLAR